MPFKDMQKRKEYHKEYSKKWNTTNKNKQRATYKKYYYAHRKDILLRKNKQRQSKEKLYFPRARRYHRTRLEIINIYSNGTYKCNNCHENRYECLQIDHINDDGSKERNSLKKGGANFYEWLLKQPIDKTKYQVLCANCNCIKRLRGTVSYNQGLKTIQEWLDWSKLKVIKTPEGLKTLWNKKKQY